MFHVVVWSENKNFWMTAVLGWVGGWSCHFVTFKSWSCTLSLLLKVISFSLKATSLTRAFLFFFTLREGLFHILSHSLCVFLESYESQIWCMCICTHSCDCLENVFPTLWESGCACLFSFPQHLAQGPLLKMCSVTICWIDEWIQDYRNDWVN